MAVTKGALVGSVLSPPGFWIKVLNFIHFEGFQEEIC